MTDPAKNKSVTPEIKLVVAGAVHRPAEVSKALVCISNASTSQGWLSA
jgi:hypothetical protein